MKHLTGFSFLTVLLLFSSCASEARTKKILPVVPGAPPSPAADLTYAMPEMSEEKAEGILGNPVVPKTKEEWGLWEQALLKLYAPDSEDILRVNSALQPSMIRDGWLVDVSLPLDFMQFVMIPSHDAMLAASPIAVHELSHSIHSLYPVVLQSQKKLPRDRHYLVYYLAKNRMTTLLKTDTIPSRDIVSGIPKLFKDAEPMARYNQYILSTNDNQTTQVEGIYGLLDELCAYYHSLRTAWELYPYFRDRLPQTAKNYFTYYNIVSDQYLACAQFQLYILCYLGYVKTNRPGMYREIMTNEGFKEIFSFLTAQAADIAQKSFLIKDEITANLRKAGYTITVRTAVNCTRGKEKISFIPNAYQAEYETYLAEMRKEKYAAILSELAQ